MGHIVADFYHTVQFPGLYTQEEVIKKSEDFFLEKFLDLSFLPFEGNILEAGCGTGYTTHVIANIRRDAKITGIDFSKGSLKFASEFSAKHNYHNTEFKWMDLRDLQFNENSFDVLICSGVLHHIRDEPKTVFKNLCKLVKKGGTVIIGLYHPWGRMSVHTRQKIFKLTGGRFRNIDPRIRNEKWTEQRKLTWYRDQYEHPSEEDYSHKKLLELFHDENIELVESIPKFDGKDANYNFYMLTKTGSQGGLYIFIGRKL